MNREIFTALCLAKFNWTSDNILKKKRANGPEIKAGDLFDIIYDEDKAVAIAKRLGFGETSLATFMRKTFPGIILTGRRTWKYYFLGEIGYKKCSDCLLIKETADYHVANTKGISGLASICKSCDYLRRRTHQVNHPEMYKAANAAARASRSDAVPKWADLIAILDIYATCPEGYQVDHIIPLRGETVCGLHVENNLRHIKTSENLSKGNKLLPEFTY
ncbi:MAG: hypothetical protein EOO61_02385 [Hymenobacter sp.]|nr:MAG: hypothetical protein EOO61_02385 [Hymenobacter sp.]